MYFQLPQAYLSQTFPDALNLEGSTGHILIISSTSAPATIVECVVVSCNNTISPYIVTNRVRRCSHSYIEYGMIRTYLGAATATFWDTYYIFRHYTAKLNAKSSINSATCVSRSFSVLLHLQVRPQHFPLDSNIKHYARESLFVSATAQK